MPGTTDDAVRAELEAASGKRAGVDRCRHESGFLTEGTAVDDFMRPDRIVIGGGDERTIAAQREVYARFSATPTLAKQQDRGDDQVHVEIPCSQPLISFSTKSVICAVRWEASMSPT